MKHPKMLLIAAGAIAALLAIAGPSAALAENTVLCTARAKPCPVEKADGIGTKIKASLLSGVKSKLTTAYKTVECGKATINGEVSSTGEAVNISLEELTFAECNCEVVVLTKGALTLERISGTYNGTVKSSGTEITVQCKETAFGTVHCIYETSATDIGTLTGSLRAKIKIEEANVPRLSTSAACAEKANWDAEYELTSPKPLYIEGSEATETFLCTEKASLCPSGKSDGSGTEIKGSLVSGTKSKLTTPYNNIECGKSSFTAKMTGVGEKASASLNALTFEECNCEVKVLGTGTLELEHIISTANARLKSTGTEVTTNCSTITGPVHCIYKTTATNLGTLKGGNPAMTEAAEAEVPHLETSSRCSEGSVSTKWDAEYEVTGPKPLYIEPEAVSAADAILCTEKTSPCPAGQSHGVGTEINLSSTGTSKLTTTFKTIECSSSSLTAEVTRTAEETIATVESLTFESCNCEVKALNKGSLVIKRISGSANGTVTSSEAEVTASCNTIIGTVHCIYYVTESTDLGTLTGGSPAQVDIPEMNIPRKPTSGICAEKALWDGITYEVTTPKPLYIEPK